MSSQKNKTNAEVGILSAQKNVSTELKKIYDGATEGKSLTANRVPSSLARLGTAKNSKGVDAEKIFKRIDLKSFDPQDELLSKTWSTYAEHVLCVNAYPNGITLSSHKQDRVFDSFGNCSYVSSYHPSQFHLRIPEMRDYGLPKGKYFLYKENYVEALENRLRELLAKGVLRNTVVYFGTANDPFTALDLKWEITKNCLELFEKYLPATVVVQTRSPMILAALPLLKELGDRLVVSISLESSNEKFIEKYYPKLPKISERLLAAKGLRKQGIEVNLNVSPILPFGAKITPRNEALSAESKLAILKFALMLHQNADHISFSSLSMGFQGEEVKLRELAIVKKLATAQEYYCLRPHAYKDIFCVIKALSPDKLEPNIRILSEAKQLSLFAA